MKNDNDVADVFGLTPISNMQSQLIEETISSEIPIVQVQEELSEIDQALIDATDDFADIRTRIKGMLIKAEDVFESAHMVASTSQNSKDIEAFAKIMDSITKTGKELMTMHKDVYTLKPPVIEAAPQQAETINNIVFQGTGADFIEYLKSKQIEDKSKKD